MTTVILDELDTDRILRVLYNGSRPKLVHTLICACGRSADLRQSPDAWDGWQLLPWARCPECVQNHQVKQLEELYPHQARLQFAVLLTLHRRQCGVANSARKEGV